MIEVKNHKLFEAGKQVKFVPTPNITKGAFAPDTIIIHFTAGSSASSALKTMLAGRPASAHLLIDKENNTEVTQLADFSVQTWHAGKSSYGKRIGYNKYSIGIEIDNPGPITKKADGTFETWYKKPVPKEAVYNGSHRNKVTKCQYWHKYTKAQIGKVYEICKALKEAYGIKYVLGHEEISPGRKSDPGPAYPLDKLRADLGFGKGPDDKTPAIVETPINKPGKIIEKVSLLLSPTDAPEAISKRLIEVGATVQVLAEAGNYYNIAAGMPGWVSGEYIDTDSTDEEHDGVVTASTLNVRQLPDAKSPIVAKPLIKGTKIDIVEENGGWFKITGDATGWVLKKTITIA